MDSVNSSERLVSCGSSDIISNLPCNILDIILTCLPMEDAARTCVLSKSWRFRWHHTSQLVFDDAYFRKRSSKSSDAISLHIFQILLLHREPLRRFDLKIPDIVKIEACFMDQFILFLTGKDIQEFTFHPWCNSNIYRLPSTFFQCTQLTHLNLSNCVFKLPHDFIGFSRLISIEVYYIHAHLSHHDFNTFISKCPLLQRLKIQFYFTEMDCLEIDAPNLKYLFLDSTDTFILFKNVPVLSTVVIKGDVKCSTDIAEVFGSLPSIEHLSANSGFLTHMCRGRVPKRLPSMLNHLKYVELSGIFVLSGDFPCALLLIRSSPRLQKLKIKDLWHAFLRIGDETLSLQHLKAPSTIEILQHLKAPSPIEHSFNQLEEVTMKIYNGSVNQLEFVKFILAEAPVLKKLTIQHPRGTTLSDEALKIVTAVTRFRRASCLAEIIFSDSD